MIKNDTKDFINLKEIEELIESITKVLQNPLIKDTNFVIDDHGCPHTPPSKLPDGSAAVYMFFYNNRALKIGKVNNKSHARFTSQHYIPLSSQSNLAKSLINDPTFPKRDLDSKSIGNWIKNNTRRIDILIKNNYDIFTTNLIEAIFQYRFKPVYEGKNTSFNPQNKK